MKMKNYTLFYSVGKLRDLKDVISMVLILLQRCWCPKERLWLCVTSPSPRIQQFPSRDNT